LGLRALVAGLVALISPLLALIRWVQEKATVYQVSEEMKRSHELFGFIESCPEMLSASQSSEAKVQDQARVELAKTLARVSDLLQRNAETAAPPSEMAWPRRLLLLYAPRSWTAVLLHLTIYAGVVLGVLIIISFGIDDQTGDFQWNKYQRMSQNNFFPILLLGLVWWTLLFSILWIAAHTKDSWDNALPHRKNQGRTFLHLETPSNARELLARITFFWVTFNLALALAFHGVATRLMQQVAVVVPALGAMLTEASKESLITRIGGVYVWAVSILSVVLTYLWYRAEARACKKKIWLPFPHSWRFLYFGSKWQERFSQLLFVLLLIRIAQVVFGIYEAHQLLSRIEQTLPSDAREGLLIGSLSVPVIDIVLSGILPLYGSYRLGLDLPPFFHPVITGVSRFCFGIEILFSPSSSRLCGCGKRSLLSTSA
jgi:hypothetical protein